MPNKIIDHPINRETGYSNVLGPTTHPFQHRESSPICATHSPTSLFKILFTEKLKRKKLRNPTTHPVQLRESSPICLTAPHTPRRVSLCVQWVQSLLPPNKTVFDTKFTPPLYCHIISSSLILTSKLLMNFMTILHGGIIGAKCVGSLCPPSRKPNTCCAYCCQLISMQSHP